MNHLIALSLRGDILKAIKNGLGVSPAFPKHKTAFLHANEFCISSEDQVIKKFNADQLSRLHEPIRQFHILKTWLRIAVLNISLG